MLRNIQITNKNKNRDSNKYKIRTKFINKLT
jgi:hypothetical protein